MLEKKRNLRKIELTFTDDLIHSDCHCVYHDIIEEDGKQIAKTVHRELDDTAKVLLDVGKKEYLVHPAV